MSRLDRDHPVIQELRKLKGCTTLRVELQDGTERKLDVPKAGNRWERLARTLDGFAWQRIEACDKDGKVLGLVEPEEDPDLDDDEADDDAGKQFAKGAKLGVALSVQVMKEARQMFGSQLDSQARLMGMVTEAMGSLQASYTLAMKVQAANLAAGDGGDEVSNMMKMGMAMMLQQKQSQPPPPPPKDANPRPVKPAPTNGGD